MVLERYASTCESGSSACVFLVLRRGDEAEGEKTCAYDMASTERFLASRVPVRETDIYVRPLRHSVAEGSLTI